MKKHNKRFIAERFIRKGDDDDPVAGRGQGMNEVLIRARCELPFTRRRGKGRRTFDLETVVEPAAQLRREEDAREGGET